MKNYNLSSYINNLVLYRLYILSKNIIRIYLKVLFIIVFLYLTFLILHGKFSNCNYNYSVQIKNNKVFFSNSKYNIKFIKIKDVMYIKKNIIIKVPKNITIENIKVISNLNSKKKMFIGIAELQKRKLLLNVLSFKKLNDFKIFFKLKKEKENKILDLKVCKSNIGLILNYYINKLVAIFIIVFMFLFILFLISLFLFYTEYFLKVLLLSDVKLLFKENNFCNFLNNKKYLNFIFEKLNNSLVISSNFTHFKK